MFLYFQATLAGPHSRKGKKKSTFLKVTLIFFPHSAYVKEFGGNFALCETYL